MKKGINRRLRDLEDRVRAQTTASRNMGVIGHWESQTQAYQRHLSKHGVPPRIMIPQLAPSSPHPSVLKKMGIGPGLGDWDDWVHRHPEEFLAWDDGGDLLPEVIPRPNSDLARLINEIKTIKETKKNRAVLG